MAGPEQELKIEDLVHDLGLTSYNRRLADKILNAFNQATAIGRSDVAERLEQALRLCLDEQQEMRNAAFLAKADCWRRFVELRDRYQELAARHGEQGALAQSALALMRQAYQEWSRL
jgi:hypothetical protein